MTAMQGNSLSSQYELVVRQGPQPGQRFPLTKPSVILGREKTVDIVIADSEVSRRHASLSWDGQHWIIEDLGSVNGVAVNGKRLTGPRVLENNDVISLGQTVTLSLAPLAAAYTSEPSEAPTAFSVPAGSVRPSTFAAPTQAAAPARRSSNTTCIAGSIVSLLGLCIILVVGAAGGYYYYHQRQSRVIRPAVLIQEPQQGDEIELGQTVTVQSIAHDREKIRRIELWVNGKLQKAETSRTRQGISPFPLQINWQPETSGRYTLLVRAFNSQGDQGHASIAVEVIEKSDRDRDGVADEIDLCPDQSGAETARGCPDRDIDGIADDRDVCPDDSGLPEQSGCPSPQPDDPDGDGLADPLDECPDQIGSPLAGGCPDVDRDGILDPEDACPNEPGPREGGGCPLPHDRDADGVADGQDVCPDQRGAVAQAGCPDRDDDGVRDLDDDCPDERGEQQFGGCPDQDRDGVPDRVDPCPHEAGPADWHGCPDNGAGDLDDDGVPDDSDLNPGEWGPPENGGAPNPGEGRDEDENDIPDDEEPLDDPLGRFNWGGLVAEVMNTMEFQALEFEVNQEYDKVYCYASLAGSPMEQYGPFQPLGERRWDIVQVMGGENGLYLVVPEGEALKVHVECGAVSSDPAQRVQSSYHDLGRIVGEYASSEWNGEVISAESEGGDDGHTFRVKYRICSGVCEPTTLAPPVIAITEILGQTWLHWLWEGDRSSIGSFNLYVNDSFYSTLPSDAHSHELGFPFGFGLPCGQTHRLYLTASRGVGEEESPPSNVLSISGGECARTVRVTFDRLLTGDLDETVGPISGEFSVSVGVGGQSLEFNSDDYRLMPHMDYNLGQIFADVRAARAACHLGAEACPRNEAPNVDYLTIDLGNDDNLGIVGQLKESASNNYLFMGMDILSAEQIVPGEYTLSSQNVELKVVIDEIPVQGGEMNGAPQQEGEGRESSLPDLTIVEVSIAGNIRQLATLIRNTGADLAATPITIRMVRSSTGEVLHEATWPDIAMPSGDFAALQTSEGGFELNDLQVIVDPGNNITELKEDNNTWEGPAEGGQPWQGGQQGANLPDLVVGCQVVDGAKSFDVRNLGQADVTGVPIELKVLPRDLPIVDDPSEWAILHLTDAIQAQTTLRWELPEEISNLPPPLLLVIDPNDLIEEKDETNNVNTCSW